MKKLLVVMPSQNLQLKNEALATLKANTRVEFDVFEFPDSINRGWMGGCNLGIAHGIDNYEYMLFANDDILAVPCSDWAAEMLSVMDAKKDVGALSCLTVNAMGMSRINVENCTVSTAFEVPACSFFFVMMRAAAIKDAGLFDVNLPGGDDLDYCYRLRAAGYRIGITPKVFVWHHYAQTGRKVYGDYWDSAEHAEKIRFAMIKKHGYQAMVNSGLLN